MLILGARALRITIRDIQEGVSTLESTSKAEEIGLEAEGVCFAGPVAATLRFFRQGDDVLVKAELSVGTKSECARCLDPVHSILKGVAENQYRPLPEVPQHAMDDVGIRYYREEEIDLSDDFREGLLLELPAKTLCSEDCKGLCPHCGQNLNEGTCDCCPEHEEVRTSEFMDLIKALKVNGKLGV